MRLEFSSGVQSALPGPLQLRHVKLGSDGCRAGRPGVKHTTSKSDMQADSNQAQNICTTWAIFPPKADQSQQVDHRADCLC